MNPKPSSNKSASVSIRLIGGIAVCLLLPIPLFATAPSWWSARGVVTTGTANDYAAVNQGQLKNIAVKAVQELDANFSQFSNTSTLNQLAVTLSGTSPGTNDYASVNSGQLKNVAQPFFDVLLAGGYQGHPLESGTYPWHNGTANDYAMANIGQVKNLFSFDVTLSSDGSGLPDWWENQYGITLGSGTAANSPAPRGDGLSYLEAYNLGLNPNANECNNGHILSWIMFGNDQNGAPGSFTDNPLWIETFDDSTYEPLSNVLITFVVNQGGGGLSLANTVGSGTAPVLRVRTDSNGDAVVYYQEPTGGPITSLITATAGTASLLFVSYNGSKAVAEWKFNQGTGATASDSSGSGANGTLRNVIISGTSFDGGGALQLDGRSGFVEVPNSGTFNIGDGPMTVMAWVRLSSQVRLATDTDVYNIAYKGITGVSGFQFALAGGSANGLVARIFSSGTCKQLTPFSDQSALLADGNWHHVAFVRDENGGASLYIDWVGVGCQTSMSGSVDSTQPLWIGRGESGGYFNGTIDDVILLRAASSSIDIGNAYNHDLDNNTLPDWWEFKYFGSIGQDPHAISARGDGSTLLQAYQAGNNPNDFYNGMPPTLSITGGGNQCALPGISSVPFSVSVNYGVSSALVTFSVTSGDARISLANNDPAPKTTVQTMTSGNAGQAVAQVYIYFPNHPGNQSVIQAMAGSGTAVTSISTTAVTSDPSLSPPTNLDAVSTAPTTADLSWTLTSSTLPTTVEASLDGGATWVTVGVAASGVTAVTITGMTPDKSVNFRVLSGGQAGSTGDTVAFSMPTQGTTSGGGTGTGSGGGSTSNSGNSTDATPLSHPILTGTLTWSDGSTTNYNNWNPGILVPVFKDVPPVMGYVLTAPYKSGTAFASATYSWKVNKGGGSVIWTIGFHNLLPGGTLSKYGSGAPLTGGPSPIQVLSWAPTGDETISKTFSFDPTNPPQPFTGGDGYYSINLLPVDIAVDSNRDGFIKFAGNANDPAVADKPTDTTSQDKPYRFWCNDDDDHGDAPGSDGTEHVPIVRPDYTSSIIGSRRDLEDFARLWINIGGLQDAITTGKIQVGLKWKTVASGTPAIKIFSSADTSGSDGYLKDDSAAAAQVTGVYNSEIKDKNNKEQVDTNGIFILPTSFWKGAGSSALTKYLLFEGCTEGKGELELVFLDQSGNQSGEGGSLWLDLMNIKKMYERGFAVAGNTTLPYNSTTTPPGPNITLGNDPNASQTFQQAWDETPQCIVIVHGFNTTYAQSMNSAETVFKRLYWLGYKGRFAAFRWAIPDSWFNGTDPGGAIGTFNNQEYLAWNSGAALKQFMASMPQNYSRNIIGHSMGNMVVGEALREGMTANHYAMLHAAASASCYSNANFVYQMTNSGVQTADTDSDAGTRNLAYKGWLGGIGANPVNFYDVNDSVVRSIWDDNNSAFKPQQFIGSIPSPWGGSNGYYYDPTAAVGQRLGISFLLSVGRFVTEPTESKAYADFSRTGTIGGANKGNNSQGGSIVDSVDDSYFGDHHGNEWELKNQDLQQFYDDLLTSFDLNAQ